ncbi:serine/threonine protein kinase [Embleya sp. NBC_00888]|uniref:serine/threonine-protein kinase n=1 Tax=Embleya sp. NBC_00888 TaxID=2975960 RepID=UPI00386C4B9B|nr:serine/threonine protein kinase [Embleya sp. NBC_00888]
MDTRGSGRLVAARYRLLEQLGFGGMGVVWRATDELLHVEVAIKQVSIGDWLPDAEREQRVARAMREARNAARLREHPHIVSVHDVVVEDGVPWIVMEYVPSRTLAEVVAEDGPLTVEQVRVVGTALVDALAAAHALGIVHRDVKPANVLFAPTGRIALVDFGIAVHEDDAGLTASGVIGTLEYIAPERLRGDAATPAADLFSLGCTLFQAVEGTSPFRREQAYASMAAVLGEPPPQPRRAGPLTKVILGLLDKDPAGRPDADRVRLLLAANVTDSGARNIARQLAAPTELARPAAAGEPAGPEGSADEEGPAGAVGPVGADGTTVPVPVHPAGMAAAATPAASPAAAPPAAEPTPATRPASPPPFRAQSPTVPLPDDPAAPLPRRRRLAYIIGAVVAIVAVIALIVVVSLLVNGSGDGDGDDDGDSPAVQSSESASDTPTDVSSEAATDAASGSSAEASTDSSSEAEQAVPSAGSTDENPAGAGSASGAEPAG